MRTVLCIVVLTLLPLASMAQGKPCTVDLPVGLIGTDGSLLQGLTAQDVTVRLSKQILPIQAINYDAGARRILLILDTSRRLVPEVRKIQTILADYVLSKARSEDSFALRTVRGAQRQVHFGESKQVLLQAIQELSADPKEPSPAGNVLDVVMDSLAWFGEPRRGDAILIMADHLEESGERLIYQSRQMTGGGPLQGVVRDQAANPEGPSKAQFKTVMSALAEHQIRVFGLQLGSMRINEAVTAKFTPNDENLFGFALGRGGFAILDSTDAFGSYVLTDERANGLRDKVWRLYGAIAQFYLLRVQVPGPVNRQPWKLELAKDLHGNTRALYPEHFDRCTEQNTH